jgi:hypothetical protein
VFTDVKAHAMLHRVGIAALTLFAAAALPSAAPADELVTLTIKDQRFTPETVNVPSGQRFSIGVVNQDPTPAEFESNDLHVEKIVVSGGKITVNIGPLKPGSYKFFDDYHPDTTGTMTATAN